jgi:hypothetical protein
MVILLHGELTGDMIGGTGITIPVCVHSVGHRIGALVLLFFAFVIGVAVPALPSFMVWLPADLAGDRVTDLAVPLASTLATCIAANAATLSVAVTTVATAAATASFIVATSSWPSASTLSGVDRGAAIGAIGEELHAAVVGADLSVQLAHGQIVSLLTPMAAKSGL